MHAHAQNKMIVWCLAVLLFAFTVKCMQKQQQQQPHDKPALFTVLKTHWIKYRFASSIPQEFHVGRFIYKAINEEADAKIQDPAAKNSSELPVDNAKCANKNTTAKASIELSICYVCQFGYNNGDLFCTSHKLKEFDGVLHKNATYFDSLHTSHLKCSLPQFMSKCTICKVPSNLTVNQLLVHFDVECFKSIAEISPECVIKPEKDVVIELCCAVFQRISFVEMPQSDHLSAAEYFESFTKLCVISQFSPEKIFLKMLLRFTANENWVLVSSYTNFVLKEHSASFVQLIYVINALDATNVAYQHIFQCVPTHERIVEALENHHSLLAEYFYNQMQISIARNRQLDAEQFFSMYFSTHLVKCINHRAGMYFLWSKMLYCAQNFAHNYADYLDTHVFNGSFFVEDDVVQIALFQSPEFSIMNTKLLFYLISKIKTVTKSVFLIGRMFTVLNDAQFVIAFFSINYQAQWLLASFLGSNMNQNSIKSHAIAFLNQFPTTKFDKSLLLQKAVENSHQDLVRYLVNCEEISADSGMMILPAKQAFLLEEQEMLHLLLDAMTPTCICAIDFFAHSEIIFYSSHNFKEELFKKLNNSFYESEDVFHFVVDAITQCENEAEHIESIIFLCNNFDKIRNFMPMEQKTHAVDLLAFACEMFL